MNNPGHFDTMPPLDRRPLSERERVLIRDAELHAWDARQHYGLRLALERRGLTPYPHASVGSMVETLEEVAR